MKLIASSRLVLFLLIPIFLVMEGCQQKKAETNLPLKESGESVQPHITTTQVPLLELDASQSQSDLAKKYQTNCDGAWCLFQSDASNALLTKSGGAPLCIVPPYENQVIVMAYFSKKDELTGAECRIDEADYQAINNALGTSNVFKRYLNQRDVFESFQVWKSPSGFIMTYKEILGSLPNGDIRWAYHIYAGEQEHPQYSKFPEG